MSPELEQIRREVEAMTHDWSEVHWHRGLPGKWTNAQIFEHLLLTYTGTSKGLRRAMDSGSVTHAKATLPHRLRKFVVISLGYMPGRRTAFKQIMPEEGLGPEDMRRFYDALVAMESGVPRIPHLDSLSRRSVCASKDGKCSSPNHTLCGL